jgi:hypothetical protein
VRPRALVLLAALAAALLPAALHPVAAAAGTYSISQDTAADVSGWSFSHDPGYSGCSLHSHPVPCNDADVPSPTPLRIFGYGQVQNLANAWWQWDAPETTTIKSGSVSVAYKTTTTGTSAYMKARLRSESFPSSPQLHADTGDGSATWTIPGGNQVVGLFLKTDSTRVYANKWNNTLAVASLNATLTDDTPPAVSVSGALADGAWHNQSQPVCLTVDASDAGAGVRSAVLAEAGTTLASDTVARQAGLHPGLTGYTHALCATPAALGDGSHTLTVTVTDAAGEASTRQVTLRVDAHAPVAVDMSPAGTTTDRRAPVSFSVDPGPSGLGQLEAEVDGAPMTVSAAHAVYTPAADLGYGVHTVTWHASDAAGNARDGSWTFRVLDAVAPVLSDVRPDDGSSTSDATPALSVAIADAGDGVDPGAIVMTIDGVDVSARGVFAGGRFSYTPAVPLALGTHTVSVRAADTGGNESAPLTWSFVVRDDAPPVVSHQLPVPGSTVPGAAAIGFDVADTGAGVDGATLAVQVDGSDVTAWGTYASGHFSYAPGALSTGVHTVSVTVADREGNVAGPVVWQFAVADPARLQLERAGGASSLVAGGRTTLRFVASASGSPLAGARMIVSRRAAGQPGFHRFQTLTTGRSGAASWRIAPLHTITYRVALASSPTVTATRTITVHRRVTLAANRLRIHPGGAVALSGRVSPASPGARVRLQLLTGGGWRTVAVARLGGASRFSKTVVAGVPGRYVLRVLAPGTGTNAPGVSRTVTVRVR